ncbi:MAG: M20 family peptidase [Clostridia bacterium]
MFSSWNLLWIIPAGLLALWLIVILVRAISFRPKVQAAPAVDEAEVDENRAIESLQKMIQCKTISYFDEALIDESEFDRFRALLVERFPRVYAACKFERIGQSGLLYTLKGKKSDLPSVFMAHYDVVPANEEQWAKPAFDGIMEDDVLWGRGTLDTKGTLNGVMEAAEILLSKGFEPKQDLYFAFAGDEEVAGATQPTIVETLRARGIKPAIVVDEGGAVVENIFPGVKQPCALIGIGEKGMMNATMTIEGAGGHASAPPAHTSIGLLSRAITEIEGHPFSRKLTKPVAEMFDTLGRHSSFAYRLIFSNLWCFMPLLDSICKKSGGELNGMMRTTCAFTQMEGSEAINVLPPKASVGANLRIIGGETPQSALAHLKKLADCEQIRFKDAYSMAPSPFSETTGEAWDKLTAAVQNTWPEALISPYLMIACSDSRHYCAISDHVYRFSAMALSTEERSYIHGNNERIPIKKIVKTVQFYLRLMRSL